MHGCEFFGICIYDAVSNKYTGIKIYSRVYISYQNITFKKQWSREKKNMNTLIKYTQMVLTDMKEQSMQHSLSTIDILIKTLPN